MGTWGQATTKSEAIPEESTGVWPRSEEPSLKLTVPVGEDPVTVADRVNVDPVVGAPGEADRLVRLGVCAEGQSRVIANPVAGGGTVTGSVVWGSWCSPTWKL